MYYDNKSTFYIKQYGPAVLTIVISLVLVLGGLYIYLSSNRNNKPQDTLVAKNVTEQQQIEVNENIETTNSLQEAEKKEEESKTEIVEKEEPKKEEVKPVVAEVETKEVTEKVNVNDIKISNTISSNIKKLSKLEKLNDVKVLGVDDNKNIVVNISENNYKISLIGIDYKKSNNNIKDKLDNDLTNKTISIAFDNVKQENDTLCAYIYVDGNLYNKELLKNGVAILKVEKANTSLLTELVNAQKEAKTNNIGIWQK